MKTEAVTCMKGPDLRGGGDCRDASHAPRRGAVALKFARSGPISRREPDRDHRARLSPPSRRAARAPPGGVQEGRARRRREAARRRRKRRRRRHRRPSASAREYTDMPTAGTQTYSTTTDEAIAAEAMRGGPARRSAHLRDPGGAQRAVARRLAEVHERPVPLLPRRRRDGAAAGRLQGAAARRAPRRREPARQRRPRRSTASSRSRRSSAATARR